LTILGVSLLAVIAGAVLFLQRRWAFVALMAGVCYMFTGPSVEIGPLHFNVLRILVTIGVLRVMVRGERLVGGICSLDRWMIMWAIWACVSSVFHQDALGALVYRLGLVYEATGTYFLIRIYCASFEDVLRLCRSSAVILLPIAIGMVFETVTKHNLFAALGNVSDIPMARGERSRAFGPSRHPILAGTLGAVTLPLIIGIWQKSRRIARVGVIACLSIVVSSASSGPLLSAIAGVAALCLWRYRDWIRVFQWVSIVGYVALDLLMKVPAYYIIARLDVVGGSTGWHRARLIQSSIEHLGEWWLAGTDHTRHWMPTGVSWSPNHTDITNHYLIMGVIGGLPLMFLFVGIIGTAFVYVGNLTRRKDIDGKERFALWALGSALFVHVVTFISVSYFDQSTLFLYLTLAGIASVHQWTKRLNRRVQKGIMEHAPFPVKHCAFNDIDTYRTSHWNLHESR
jgi:hypothetical protein